MSWNRVESLLWVYHSRRNSVIALLELLSSKANTLTHRKQVLSLSPVLCVFIANSGWWQVRVRINNNRVRKFFWSKKKQHRCRNYMEVRGFQKYNALMTFIRIETEEPTDSPPTSLIVDWRFPPSGIFHAERRFPSDSITEHAWRQTTRQAKRQTFLTTPFETTLLELFPCESFINFSMKTDWTIRRQQIAPQNQAKQHDCLRKRRGTLLSQLDSTQG